MKWLLCLLLFLPSVGAAQWLDPDGCWTCRDKREHFVAGATVDLLIRPLIKPSLQNVVSRILITCGIGIAYEGVQLYEDHQSHRLGQRGFGFGIGDVMADCLGATAMEGVIQLGRRIL